MKWSISCICKLIQKLVTKSAIKQYLLDVNLCLKLAEHNMICILSIVLLQKQDIYIYTTIVTVNCGL